MPATLHIAEGWTNRLNQAGLGSAASWWADERVRAWRNLPERQNAVVDLDGERLHVKRFKNEAGDPVAPELEGLRLLREAEIPTLEVVAHAGGPRALLVTKDLTGLVPGDALMREGGRFDDLLEPTAALAARLHRAGLHHRDLYLCHFLLRPDGSDCHLIDAARVRRLPWLTKRRWIVKDVAQFVYSARRAHAATGRIEVWLNRWASEFGVDPRAWRNAINRKANAIAVRDFRAKVRQRDVSLDLTMPAQQVDRSSAAEGGRRN